MRIAYFSNSPVPSTQANSVHVMKMTQAFSSLGHPSTLVVRSQSPVSSNIYDYYGVKPAFNIVSRPWPAVRLLGGMIYGLSNRLFPPSMRAELFFGRDLYSLLFHKNKSTPIIFESHQLPTSDMKIKMEAALFESESFKGLVVISDPLKEMYLDAFPQLSPEKVLVLHDGADDPFHGASTPEEHSNERIQVGYVGGLYEGRGVEIIQEAAARLPQMDFHFLGGPHDKARVLREINSLPNVFVHGFVAPGKLKDFYKTFHIAVAPYQKKVAVAGGGDTSKWMSPLKLFEYMAWAKPIIASDLPAIRSIVDNNKTGLLCECDNVESWVLALKELGEKKNIREELREQARTVFLKKHTWKARAEKALTLLDR
ncbi:MAG: glycosyltransferase [Desulfovibrio sp.]